jgi:protein SCO1/2
MLIVGLAIPAGARAADDRALAWQQHPGARLARDTRVLDEAGRSVAIGEAFGRTPVILDLGYYHCPSLCGVARSDLIDALANSGMVSGRDFRVAVLSIDPAETPADAARAKAADGSQAGWQYFTASQAAIDAVSATVGFQDRYDAALKQFMHPAGIVVLTKSGVVNSYLLGVGYSGGEVRAAVLRAGSGGIARAALPILLLCFHFDASTGRYTLAVVKLLKLLAGLTVAGVLGLMVALSRARRAA